MGFGFLTQGSVDYDFGLGLGGAFNETQFNLIGGKYGGWWNKYVGSEFGPNASIGGGASVDGTIEFFVAVYQGEETNPSPKTFEGLYTALSLDAEIHAGIGAAGFLSYTFTPEWKVYAIGGGIGFGGNVKATGDFRLGNTKLITPVEITSDRSIMDFLNNHILQFMF